MEEETIWQEEWKDIEGFSKYQISNFGRVKSKERTTIAGNRGGKRYRPEKIMKGCDFGYEYLKVNLRDDEGKTKNIKVHRLVCQAFIPNPLNKFFVNHKDFNRCNNRMDNLEWVTAKENSEHMVKAGRHNNKSNYRNK